MRLLALFAAVLIVYIDRDGYRDVQENQLSFLDCLYYATVSLSTTGYGDITPFTPTRTAGQRPGDHAAAGGVPDRADRHHGGDAHHPVAPGPEDPAMEEQSAQPHRRRRYGTKGRTAVSAMVGDEVAPADIVVVDENATALERAKSAGLVTVHGDATKSEVLRLASAQHAKSIIVATDDDASAVLVTLTARELAPNAKIIAAAREAENQHLLRQSGADSTVVSSETAGRLLGIATTTPSVVEMMEDLLTPDAGFAIAERPVELKEVGGSPRHLSDIVLGVVRDARLVRVDAAEVDALEEGDRLLYIRSADAER